MNKLSRFCLAAFMLAALGSGAGAAVELPATHDKIIKPDPDAVAAATAWLRLIDESSYEKAFAAFPERIRSAGNVAQQESNAYLRSRRGPLGAVRSRKLARARFSHTMASAPDGNYEYLDYQTVFARKAEALEVVTLTRESGHWQVSGYHVR